MNHTRLSRTWTECQVDNGPVQFRTMALVMTYGATHYRHWQEHRARVIRILLAAQIAAIQAQKQSNSES